MEDKQDRKMARAVFKVRDIDCATCALAIEKRVKRVGGVKDVGVAVMLNQVYIDYDESQTNISEVEKAIDKAGYSNYLIRREAK